MHALLIKTLQLIKINPLSSQVKVYGMTCGVRRCVVCFHKLVSWDGGGTSGIKNTFL